MKKSKKRQRGETPAATARRFPHGKHLLIIGVAAILASAASAYYILQQKPAQPGETVSDQQTEEQAARPGGLRSMAIALNAQNESGEFGTAAFTDADGQTSVVLELGGVPLLVPQPAHIHAGSCEDLGSVAYPLREVVGTEGGKGDSESLVDASLQELLAELPLAVNVHRSAEEIGVYVACGNIGNPADSQSPSLLIRRREIGTGPEAEKGDVLIVHYVGTLEDGTQFDSSRERGEPFRFQLGAGQVIRGWDIGLEGMRVGGKRQLTIPPELAYGERGAGALIPPNATLIFEVELLEIQGK